MMQRVSKSWDLATMAMGIDMDDVDKDCFDHELVDCFDYEFVDDDFGRGDCVDHGIPLQHMLVQEQATFFEANLPKMGPLPETNLLASTFFEARWNLERVLSSPQPLAMFPGLSPSMGRSGVHTYQGGGCAPLPFHAHCATAVACV